MKKIICLVLALVMCALVFAGCSKQDTTNNANGDISKIKVGYIFLHDDTSTYDKNFIEAATAAKNELGLKDDQVIFKTSIPEGDACYETAADLVDQGCNVIFANSFGHEPYLIKAAKEFPNVQFCHATGTKAHTENLPNHHNAFADIYMGRYIAGVAAGMKLNQMIQEGKITEDQAIMGYVGAFPYAEVKSGYTSFYLGAKSVCPKVTMKVDFTNSWYSVDGEREVANKLITQEKCVIISQHADSMGAPGVCEENNVPNVFYNGTTDKNTYLVASRINWTPYFKYMIEQVAKGEPIKYDYVGTLKDGGVIIEKLNTNLAAPGTAEKLEEVRKALIDGTTKVFDTNSFTVKGQKLTSYIADVDDAGDFVPETEVIKDGYFHESEYRSAPYFDIDIDGITLLSTGN